MKIAVCIPSRGLIHSRTIETVIANLNELPEKEAIIRLFLTHDRPIPEAQNKLVERAKKWGANLFWFCEEDNFIPQGTLLKMIRFLFTNDCGVVAVDYPVGEKRCSTIARKNGEILWTGLGCTLVRREVFDKLNKPYFRTDRTFRIISKDPLELLEERVPNKYGGQDIWFGMSCKKAGIPIYQLPDIIAGHIKPKLIGKNGTNGGFHEFEIWDEIKTFQNYN